MSRAATPLFYSNIANGIPTTDDDSIEKTLNLTKYLIKNPASTFFAKVKGDSMINSGIYENDILVIDKSLNPINNDIIIAFLDGEFLVKRLQKTSTEIQLISSNTKYSPVKVNNLSEFQIWGVVIFCIHKTK